MKRTLIALITAYLLIAAGWALVQGASQGKEVAVTGKISCAYCNLSAPGNCTKESCRAGVIHGNPVLLTDTKGNRYMLLSEKKEKPLMAGERMHLLREKSVHGKLVKLRRIRAIRQVNGESVVTMRIRAIMFYSLSSQPPSSCHNSCFKPGSLTGFSSFQADLK
jgi:hypothetical protein